MSVARVAATDVLLIHSSGVEVMGFFKFPYSLSLLFFEYPVDLGKH